MQITDYLLLVLLGMSIYFLLDLIKGFVLIEIDMLEKKRILKEVEESGGEVIRSIEEFKKEIEKDGKRKLKVKISREVK